jgi:putative nucleotidyltransferase with HDIG domain
MALVRQSQGSPGADPIRLALLSADKTTADRLSQALPQRLFSLALAEGKDDLAALLAQGEVEAVLIDLTAPRRDNRAGFELARSSSRPVPVLVCGRRVDLATVKTFLTHGAFGFLDIAEEPDLILHAVRSAAGYHRVCRDNAGLRETVSSQGQAMEALKRVGDGVGNLFDLRHALDLTLKVVRRGVDCEVCALFLIDGEGGRLVDSREACRRDNPLQLELWDGEVDRARRELLEKAARRALQEGRILDLAGEDLFPGGWARRVAALPIMLEGRPRGVLAVANKLGAERFTADDLEILHALAGQTAFLLGTSPARLREATFQESLASQLVLASTRLKKRNLELSARLEEEEAARQQIAAMADEISEKNDALTAMLEQFRAIHQVSSEFGSEVESDVLLSRIINVTASHLSADTVSLMLRDEEGILRIVHAVGLTPEVTASTGLAPGEGIAGWVAQEGKPILVRDAAKFRRARPDRAQYYTNSLLCVPIRVKGKVTGVLNVTNRVEGTSFEEKDLNLLIILGNHAGMALENTRLYQAIRDSYFKTIKVLVNAVEAKDSWTRDHSENVTNYSLKIADYLGLSEKQKETIRYAGVLHDIGKIVISSSITEKQGRLDEVEWQRMREHPLIGQRILDPIDYLDPVKVCIQTHHERCDGKGYPFGLTAPQIPLETRIISVADAFDAMTHSRPYRQALSLAEAVNELRTYAGTQFDPVVVDGLVRILEAEGEAEGTERPLLN